MSSIPSSKDVVVEISEPQGLGQTHRIDWNRQTGEVSAGVYSLDGGLVSELVKTRRPSRNQGMLAQCDAGRHEMDDLMSVNGGIGRVRAVCWCVHCGRLDYVVRNLDGDVVGRLADPLLPSRQ